VDVVNECTEQAEEVDVVEEEEEAVVTLNVEEMHSELVKLKTDIQRLNDEIKSFKDEARKIIEAKNIEIKYLKRKFEFCK
jgi:predicted RNase H-like nuclease (RuvC/YqgF family)